MSSSNLIRWGGLAAMMAGALFAAANLLSLSISPKLPSSAPPASEPYAIQSALKLIAAALLLLGLFGLHARQAEVAGLLGTAGLLAAFPGTAPACLASSLANCSSRPDRDFFPTKTGHLPHDGGTPRVLGCPRMLTNGIENGGRDGCVG